MIVCVSPTYYSSVRDRDLQNGHHVTSEGTVGPNNATLLYQHMYMELKKNKYKNERFIPVLVNSATYDDAPRVLKRVCPKEMFYRFPQNLRSLLYHLMKPEKVMNRLIEKYKLVEARPFDTFDVNMENRRENTDEAPITM